MLAFQAPLLFSASGWSLCLVRRDAEVELLDLRSNRAFPKTLRADFMAKIRQGA